MVTREAVTIIGVSLANLSAKMEMLSPTYKFEKFTNIRLIFKGPFGRNFVYKAPAKPINAPLRKRLQIKFSSTNSQVGREGALFGKILNFAGMSL